MPKLIRCRNLRFLLHRCVAALFVLTTLATVQVRALAQPASYPPDQNEKAPGDQAPSDESTKPTSATPLSAERVSSLHRQAMSLYTAGKYSEALAVYATILEHNSLDVIALYNSACVQAKLEHPRKAAQLLVVAVSAGFIDFERMMHDPDLDTVRNEPEYEAIMEMRGELRSAAADRLEAFAREWLGKDAIIERHDDLRIIFAASLDRDTYDHMKARLVEQLRWQVNNLFDGPPNSFVIVLIPTPEQADRMIGSSRVGGFYDHETKRLVTRDLGPSLQHELTHALHHAQMERLGQIHPMWIQEGLASVFEMYGIDSDTNAINVLSNTRINIAINLRQIHGLTPWDQFFKLSDRRFVGSRPRARYAEARAVFQFLGERGKLVDWYKSYVAHFDEDPSGTLAFQKAFGDELGEVERDFRDWLAAKEKVPEGVPDNRPALGLWVADQGANDGVEIVGVHPNGAARRTVVVPGEVILEVDGQSVFSAEEVVRAILKRSSGEIVTLRLRRGTRYHELEVKIRPVGESRDVDVAHAPGTPV